VRTLEQKLRGSACNDKLPAVVSGRAAAGPKLCLHPDAQPPQHLRFGFWNCGGFPIHAGDTKDHEICQALLRYKFDLIGLAETYIAWHLLPPNQRIRERTWGWFQKLSVSSSYASKFPAVSPFLVGGTATFALNNSVHRVVSMDSDSSGMGRWSSVRLRGKNQRCVRIVTAYRCVKNFHGPLSAWNQQRFILDSCNREEDPIEAFDNDIIVCLK
jgi:hypothetical protein